jgi:aminoglycoside phosphotransferase family enzyme/predicted kinase
MLQREQELNAPAAPEIYLGLVPVTRADDGGLVLGGEGAPVEWCLHMRRFPAGAELSAVAARGKLTRDMAASIGRVVADLHARAEPRPQDGRALMADIAAQLETGLAGMTDVLGPGRVARFRDRVSDRIAAQGPLLTARGQAGHVRRGHGDLHLGNMVLLEGRPVPFDALEFDERLGTIDVLYDLAFVLMDLLHRGFPAAANAVLGAWLQRTDAPDHLDGLAALPLFLGLRAGIRAMVSVQAARLARDDAGDGIETAMRYLDAGLAHLAPPAPRLVAVGGLSGTGKTTLARWLAPEIGPAPGAVHLRSDVERKAIFGVDPQTPLPAEAYTDAAGQQVYARLRDRAGRILAAGHGVVLDAVFDSAEERDAVAALARRAGVPLTGLWLQAGEEVLVSRVSARTGDASDADAAVVHGQLARGGAAPEWISVEASGTPETTLHRARAALPRPRDAG